MVCLSARPLHLIAQHTIDFCIRPIFAIGITTHPRLQVLELQFSKKHARGILLIYFTAVYEKQDKAEMKWKLSVAIILEPL